MRSMISVATIVAMVAIASPVWADDDSDSGGFNYSPTTQKNLNVAHGGKGGNGGQAKAYGGQGGEGYGFGGQGGNGYGLGVGKGGHAHSNANAGAIAGSKAGASSRSGVIGSGNSESDSAVLFSGNSKNDLTQKTRVGVDTSLKATNKQGQIQGQEQDQEQYNLQGQVGIQGQRAKTGSQDTVVTYESDDDTTVLTINPAALANMPEANCQGESTTGTAGGGTPAFGLNLGFGDSDESWDCNVRYNAQAMAAMAAVYGFSEKEMVALKIATVRAFATTSGFSALGAVADAMEAEVAATEAVAEVETKVEEKDEPMDLLSYLSAEPIESGIVVKHRK